MSHDRQDMDKEGQQVNYAEPPGALHLSEVSCVGSKATKIHIARPLCAIAGQGTCDFPLLRGRLTSKTCAPTTFPRRGNRSTSWPEWRVNCKPMEALTEDTAIREQG